MHRAGGVHPLPAVQVGAGFELPPADEEIGLAEDSDFGIRLAEAKQIALARQGSTTIVSPSRKLRICS